MINEKIQNLLKELQTECEKEGVTALCTLTKEDRVLVMTVGRLPQIAACLLIQENELDNELPVPAEVLRNIAKNALDKVTEENVPDHTFVIDDLNDIPDILDHIVKGEF